MSRRPPTPIAAPPEGLFRRLGGSVDGASTVFFRAAFGALMAIDLATYVLGRNLERLYLTPLFRFTFPGFEWVVPLPDGLLRALFWLLVGLAILLAVGWRARLTAGLLSAGLAYVFLLDAANYNNHNYLIVLLGVLLAVVPVSRVPAAASRRGSGTSSTVPVWGLWLLRLQIGIPYVYGGLAKINGDWLLRAQPLHLWLSRGDTGGPLHLSLFDELWFAHLLSWGGFLLDLLCVPLLLWRRTRLATFAVLVAFHLTNAFLFNIGIFPWLMIAATTIFLAPSWPRRLRLAAGPPPDRLPAAPPKRFAVALLSLYVFLQLALPFRHLLYPGDVDWTEEGHRFAWRMKLRDKRGSVRFAIVDERTRQVSFLEGLEQIFTARQRAMMEHDPELMRQTAAILARRFEEAGRGRVEVRVLTSLSLNDHPPQPLVDPAIDLARAPHAWWRPAPWILPRRD